jgi:DNA-binding CsgD family transcriptional regulator
MQASFARTLLELHELADQVPPAAFAPRALALVRHWVGFDGAVFGTGEALPPAAGQLQITQAHVEGRSSAILDDYAAVSASDPVTAAFVAGLPRPLRVDCAALYRPRERAPLQAFSRTHGLRHLMLFGEPPASAGAGRWMVLYREQGRGFSSADAEAMHGLWLHVARALGERQGASRRRIADRLPVLEGLTAAENEVARRFAAGLSHKEIARELAVSPNTVRSHLLHAYTKLGVHDKGALAACFGLDR